MKTVKLGLPDLRAPCPECQMSTLVPGRGFEFTGRSHEPYVQNVKCKRKTCGAEFKVVLS